MIKLEPKVIFVIVILLIAGAVYLHHFGLGGTPSVLPEDDEVSSAPALESFVEGEEGPSEAVDLAPNPNMKYKMVEFLAKLKRYKHREGMPPKIGYIRVYEPKLIGVFRVKSEYDWYRYTFRVEEGVKFVDIETTDDVDVQVKDFYIDDEPILLNNIVAHDGEKTVLGKYDISNGNKLKIQEKDFAAWDAIRAGDLVLNGVRYRIMLM